MKLVTFDDHRTGRIDGDLVVELDCRSMREYFERGWRHGPARRSAGGSPARSGRRTAHGPQEQREAGASQPVRGFPRDVLVVHPDGAGDRPLQPGRAWLVGRGAGRTQGRSDAGPVGRRAGQTRRWWA
jgi:hypothetical protein